HQGRPRRGGGGGAAGGGCRDRHHLAAQFVEEAGGEGADVAEALDGGGGAGRVDSPFARHVLEHEDGAAAGGRLASLGAAELERLAGHHGRGVAVLAAVLVHDP